MFVYGVSFKKCCMRNLLNKIVMHKLQPYNYGVKTYSVHEDL